MKLTFFLLALGLILLRLSYPTLRIWHNRHGQGMISMRNGEYIEEVNWLGKIRLSDDERSIAEISPGGYLNYRDNDTTLKAESNLQGEISYRLYNGHEEIPLNDSGRQFIALQIQKMIRFGFFAEGRAEKIFKKGGLRAVLAELSRIKMDGARDQYLDVLFKSDSLSRDEQISLLRLIDSSNDMNSNQQYLSRFTGARLRDSAVARQWLSSVGRLDASYFKKDLLIKYADTGLPPEMWDSVMAITRRFGSDIDEQEVCKRFAGLPPLRRHDSAYAQPWLTTVGHLQPSYMKKDLLLEYLRTDSDTNALFPADQFDTVLVITDHFGSPIDEQEVYKRLADLPAKTDGEWVGLIRATQTLHEDYLKSELLQRIAPKMPRTDSLQSAYRSAAKTIRDDMNYGKTMRALDGN